MIVPYLRLQLNRSHRAIRAFGISPLVAYPLILVLLAGFCQIIFIKIPNAKFLMVLMALFLIRTSSNPQRDEFLKNANTHQNFRKIKLIEASILLLPFFIVLLIKGYPLLAFLLVPKALAVSFLPSSNKRNKTLPTPFSKKPFEFSRGFRKNLAGLLLALLLCMMGVIYKNQNLSFFALILTLFLCIQFYAELESPYYIWIHSLSPRGFLHMKIRTALLQTALLSGPILLLLLLFYSSYWFLLVMITCWGLLFMTLFIIAKYGRTPEPMNLTDALLLGACLLMPPLMLVFIPYFYQKSTRQLEALLT